MTLVSLSSISKGLKDRGHGQQKNQQAPGQKPFAPDNTNNLTPYNLYS